MASMNEINNEHQHFHFV